MKTDLETIANSFWMGHDAYYGSRIEAEEAWNMYHNRQWTTDQLGVLESRGQPKETFNVIKMFSRLLVGYYSTVVNRVRAMPTQASDQTIASLMTDTVNSVFEHNNMDIAGDEVKLSGIISGLMCIYQAPIQTGERDQFGRPLYEIEISQVPDYQLVLDPLSTRDDYKDARFLHRFKWLTEDAVIAAFGQAKTDKLVEYYNYLNIDEAEFEYSHGDQYQGRYRVFDNYLITHTVIVDNDNRRWSIFWCGDVELRRDEITYRDVKWNYRVVKLQTSNYTEYYGIFREVTESQKAINQALVKLQLMVNSQKVFVEKGGVENLNDFADAVNRVNGIIPVKSLSKIKVENIAREALELYQVIDQALNRIQRVLSINDSFLGMAYASDSGRKVKLQQNATILALRYLTVRIETFYRLMGEDTVKLIRQFYTANQVLRVADEIVGARFIELNQPLQIPTGEIDANGQPVTEVAFEEVLNPDTQKPEVTEDGQLVFAPVPEEGTELRFSNYDVYVDTVAYNDEDERTQLLTETVMSGAMGQMLAQVNPAGFFKVAGLNLRTMKTKYSPEISRIFEETAEMLSQNPEEEEGASQAGSEISNSGSQLSKAMKLPTNTNEAV